MKTDLNRIPEKVVKAQVIQPPQTIKISPWSIPNWTISSRFWLEKSSSCLCYCSFGRTSAYNLELDCWRWALVQRQHISPWSEDTQKSFGWNYFQQTPQKFEAPRKLGGAVANCTWLIGPYFTVCSEASKEMLKIKIGMSSKSSISILPKWVAFFAWNVILISRSLNTAS